MTYSDKLHKLVFILMQIKGAQEVCIKWL